MASKKTNLIITGTLGLLLGLSSGLIIGAVAWSNSSSKNLGDETIIAQSRDSVSGTYEVFVDFGLLGDESWDNPPSINDGMFSNDAPNFSSNVQTVTNNEITIGNVEDSINSIGYTSYDIIKDNSKVKLLGFPMDASIAEEIDSVTGLPFWQTKDYIYRAVDATGSPVLDSVGNIVYYAVPTEESISSGHYKMARNFHMTWLGDGFYDFGSVAESGSNPYSVSNWPTTSDSNWNDQIAASLAFFAYATYSSETISHKTAIEKEGLLNRPETLSGGDLDYVNGYWPTINSAGDYSSDINSWLINNNLSSKNMTIYMQGSTSTRPVDSSLMESFNNEFGTDWTIDQTNSNGSGSAFNRNQSDTGYTDNVYIGTQSRRFKDSEAFNSDGSSKGNIDLYVWTDSNSNSVVDYTGEDSFSIVTNESQLDQGDGIISLDYFAYAIDGLAMFVNVNIATEISGGGLIQYITPEILREIYLVNSSTEKNWNAIVKEYYF